MEEIESKAVIKKIMDDGTFDELRHKVVERLKEDKNLIEFTENMVLNSNTFQDSSARKMPKKVLLEKLRKELEIPVLERALKAVWEVLSDKEKDLPKRIETTVHEAFCAVRDEQRSTVESMS